MALFDVVAPAADTIEVQAGGRGFGEEVGMALTAGAAGAVMSGVYSIYNTFASGANVLGANAELLNTQESLDAMDTEWGNYYKENKSAIDVAGFIGTSLIPGTLGIKALNAARAGSGAGAIGRALGFAETRQAANLSAALKELSVEGGSVFTNINRHKVAAMAWGAADQTLQAAAFETAVALTMKQSPLLADDSWWDIGKSALTGAVFGGVIGGGIDALILNKSFKTAVGALDARARNYDYVARLDDFGLDKGDKAFAIVDSLLKMPLEVLPEDKILDLSFHVGRPDKVAGWNPTTKRIDLDVGEFLKKSKTGAEKNALLDFEKNLRELAPSSDVATPWANKILGDFKQLRDAGKDPTLIREQMGDWLYELKGVKAATEIKGPAPDELWYFKKQFTPDELGKLATLDDWKAAVTRSSPFDENAYKDPYVFLGSTEQKQNTFKNAAFIGDNVEGANRYPTLKAAWAAGHDVAFMSDGALRVNDSSPLWRRVTDPIYKAERFVNTRTGTFTEDAVLTAADTVMPGAHMQVLPNAVKLPTKDGATKIISMGAKVPEGADVEYFTARHAWASKLDDSNLPREIEVTDFSLMDRLRSVQDPEILKEIKILRSPDSGTIRQTKELSSQELITAQAKLNAKVAETDGAVRKVKIKTGEEITLTNKVMGDGDTLIKAVDSTGKEIGAARIAHDVRPGQAFGDVDVTEAMRRQGVATAMYNFAEKLSGVKLAQSGVASNDAKAFWQARRASAEDVLGTANNLSIDDTIRSAKLSEAQRLFAEAHEAGKSLDVRAVAYQLNVDAPWLENAVAVRFRENLAGVSQEGTRTVNMSEGISLPLDIYTRRENLVAEFGRPQQFTELTAFRPEMGWRERRLLIMDQLAMTGGQFVSGELAWSYRVQTAIKANKNAAVAVEPEIKNFLELQQDAARLADSAGAGASPFGASNADYGDTLRLWAQDSGKKTHLISQKRTAEIADTFSPLISKIRADRQAAAEIGIVTNLLRGSDEKYIWAEAARTAGGRKMMLRELDGLTGDDLTEALAAIQAEGRKAYIDVKNPTAAEFLSTHSVLNANRIQRRQVLMSAKGLTTSLDPRVIYAPPIDTTYFKHFAFVRPKEGKAFGTSEVTMVFGRDAAELQKRIAVINTDQFDVITKKGTEDWFKAKDLYDFDKTINEPRINSELRRTGALSNIYPEVRAETVAEDYIRWHQNQAGRLVRDAVETNYAQQFAEIRKLGETYTEIATSKFSGSTKRTSTEIVNPFDDYIKTALDVSKRSEYTFLHQANEFVDALGVRAYQALQSAFGDAKKGLLPWEEVNAIAERHGIKGMYNNQEEYFLSNVPRDRNLIKTSINKANMFLANTVLRLDFFNSIVNTVSTPLMLSTELASIKTLVRNDPALLGKLGDALTVSVPGEFGPGKGFRVPSSTKLIAKAVENYFGDTGKTLIARYKANGDIKEISSQFHSMIDDLAMRADYKVFSAGVEKAFETGAKFTGNNLAEEFTRFVSADVMRQLTEDAVQAGKLSLKEQNAFISVFTNRVQGNYISSQRPIVFQGVLGSAVSLFQTYSFNLMQQLLRHVANKDKRAVATMFGMQAGLFGLNGTPFFEAVNTHIIGNAAINQGHYDAYSIAPQMLGKEMGDWLMYGTASAMPIIMNGHTPALYTRGDINPRHMSILPLNPADIPAIDASKRIVANILDIASKLGGGAAVGQTLLQGLEHNGINRPLAGLAQVIGGQATTSKGSLISASNDLDLITSASRIMGSKPMDEAIALNNLYRMKAYQVADTDRREQLGEKVKTYLYKNQMPPDDVMEKFMKDYAQAGGRAENFYGSIQKWSKAANTSVVEQMRAKLKTSYGQRLTEIMGGEPLPDYQNMQITPAASDVPTGEAAPQ